MMMKQVHGGKAYLGRLTHGADLLDELTQVCVDRGIELGRVEALGAVQKACIGYYDQKTREYGFTTLDRPMEILKLTGNVSLKDGKPLVHAHITLADHGGAAFGGHLAQGTVVFACEVLVQRLEGAAYERAYDEETGLPLWRE